MTEVDESSSPVRRVRLDMQHGFMKVIVKNQIERDEFERGMQELSLSNDPERVPVFVPSPDAATTPQTPASMMVTSDSSTGACRSSRRTPRTNAKPERATYVPPHLRSKTSVDAGPTDPTTPGNNNQSGSGPRPVTTAKTEPASSAHAHGGQKVVERAGSGQAPAPTDAAMRARVRERVNKDIRQLSVQKQMTAEKAESLAKQTVDAHLQTSRTPLFRFEFEDKEGEVHEYIVCKGDNPCRVTKALCIKLNLPESAAAQLRKHIEEKMQSIEAKESDVKE